MATPQIGPVDEAAVKKSLKELDAKVDALLPHLNKAQSAFGGLDEQQAALTDLKNKIAHARAVYGA